MIYVTLIAVVLAAVGLAYWLGRRSGIIAAERKALEAGIEERERAKRASDSGLAAFPGVRADS